jgi:hypothetical protein
MSNEDSREIKDTRGRPRDEAMVEFTDRILECYRADILPVYFDVPGTEKARKKEAKKLRNAKSFVDLQQELGIRLRVLPTETGFLVCLRIVG